MAAMLCYHGVMMVLHILLLGGLIMNEITFAVLCELLNNAYAISIDKELLYPVTYPDMIEFGGNFEIMIEESEIKRITVTDYPSIILETESEKFEIVLLTPKSI
jgi:hypothetical protein